MLEFFWNFVLLILSLVPMILIIAGLSIKSSVFVYASAVLSIPFSIGPTPVTLIIPLLLFLSGYLVRRNYFFSFITAAPPLAMSAYVFAYFYLV